MGGSLNIQTVWDISNLDQKENINIDLKTLDCVEVYTSRLVNGSSDCTGMDSTHTNKDTDKTDTHNDQIAHKTKVNYHIQTAHLSYARVAAMSAMQQQNYKTKLY